MIRYDRTRISVVIVCDCGWTDVAVSKTSAWTLAADHETRVHPGRRQIRRAEGMRRARSSDQPGSTAGGASPPPRACEEP